MNTQMRAAIVSAQMRALSALVTAALCAAITGCGDDAAEPAPQPGAGAGAGGSGGSVAPGAGAGAGAGRSGAGSGGAGMQAPRAGAGSGAGGAGAPATGGTAGGEEDAGSAGMDAGPPDPPNADPCADDPGPYGDPLPAARTATLIEDGFDFLEGPVWIDSEGVLLFSDMHMGQAGGSWPPATIVRLTPPNAFDPFEENANTNGLALTHEGELIGCTHDVQTLSLFDLENGDRTPIELTYMGDHFNSPNDLTVRSDGTVYFTDPDWQLGGRTNETGMTGVYRVPPGGDPELIDGTLDKPNGIALSPDERTLYVGSAGQDLMAYPVDENGLVGDGEVFASPGGSDGLTVDCAGNLYVTAGGVQVFDPEGDQLGSITVAESPANVAFGGADRRTLYITARTGLYSIVLNVPGYPY